GTITVMLNQGVAEYYKLLMEMPAGSGTFIEVAGPQGAGEDTTVFMDIVPGHYRIVIKDDICGNEVVITYFVFETTSDLFLSETFFCNGEGIVTLQAFGMPPFTYQM